MQEQTTQPGIVITMGPSLTDEAILREVLSNPVTHVRFNMSHGTKEEHKERLSLVKKVSEDLGKKLTLFVDLQGPKIRAIFDKDEILCRIGDVISISAPGEGGTLSTSIPDLYTYVHPGDTIAFHDGKILSTVREIKDTSIYCTITQEGTLLKNKGINIPGVDLPIASFTEKDKEDVLFALEHSFDALALSFVRSKQDILDLRMFLEERSSHLPIIAKIETRQSLMRMNEIITEIDMLMVARGDLGIEIPVSEIPITQKELCFIAKKYNVPVIVATEILKTMTENPFPTRAEVSDAMNALLDGASYLMLSDETTTGKHPKDAVTVLSSVIGEYNDHHAKYARFQK
jgi:pyruvate kinase